MKKSSVFALSALLACLLLVSQGCVNDGSSQPGDPEPLKLVLDWSTYWGGQGGYGATCGRSLAVAANGDLIVAGETQNRAFFIKNPAAQLDDQSSNGFVTRFAADGREVVYSFKLGSAGRVDWCTGVAIDASGNALVVGLAGGADFPLKDPLYPAFSGEWGCGFLCSIPPNGGSLNFSTFIPQGVPTAVAVGVDGAIYLALQGNHVLKVAADGSRLLYDFQVSADESGMDIYGLAVAADGRAWVTGYADYSFAPLLNPLQPAAGIHNGEVLVARINAVGSALDFSTLLGGNDEEYGYSVALDGDGMVYVLGSTRSPDFPKAGAIDPNWNGNYDAFLLKIDPGAPRLVYSTYVGGDGEDRGTGLALTAGGEAWIAGLTTSRDLPVTGSYQDRLAGVKDVFVAKLSADGRSWRALSYFGGAQGGGYEEVGADWCNALGLGANGSVFLTGQTCSSDFPMKNALDPLYDRAKAFVSAFREIQ